MKKALVLSGGGTKGVYQVGAIEALRETGNYHFDIITGTSVGALNAAMLVQGDFEQMVEMYENLEPEQIINGYFPQDMSLAGLIRDRKKVMPVLSDYFKNEGLDISPFLDMVDYYYAPDRFFASKIDFGCIAATKHGHKPFYITKAMMREKGRDYLIASAAAYPAFPLKNIDGVEYVDGGYVDNSPIDFALRLGADEVVAVEMHKAPVHPFMEGRDHITIIHPQEELFNLLEFDKEKMMHARALGYADTMKKLGFLRGLRYAFQLFDIPSSFSKYSRDLLLLETRAYLASTKKQPEGPVTEALKTSTGKAVLRTEDYFFGLLDILMALAKLDDAKVWTFDGARTALRVFCETAGEKDYAWEDVPYFGAKSDFGTKPDRQKGFVKLMNTRVITDDLAGAYPLEAALVEFYRAVIGNAPLSIHLSSADYLQMLRKESKLSSNGKDKA